MKKLLFALLILTAAKAGAQKQLTSPKYIVLDSSITAGATFANVIGKGLELRKIDSAGGGYYYRFYDERNQCASVFVRYGQRKVEYSKRTIDDLEVTAPDTMLVNIFNKYFSANLSPKEILDDADGFAFIYKSDNYVVRVIRNLGLNKYDGTTTIMFDHLP